MKERSFLVQPAEFFPKVTPPSLKAADAAREFQLTLTKPTGSLARLEDLGVWLASCQDQVPPKKLTQPRMVIFAGDHGVATKKVSPYPKEVSIQMAANIKAGGGGINAIANESGIGIRVVDISLDHDEDVDVVGLQERVRRSCGSIDVEDLGIGNTSPSAVIIGLLTGQEPVVVTGRGSGVNDEGWKRKVAVVRDAMFRARKDKGDVLTLMRKVTSPELVAMAAFLAQSAVRRTPIVLDGVVVTAAALLAERLAPGARAWMQAGHRSAEPAHTFALESLKLEPLLDLGLRLGEGSGAAAAFPLVRMATNIMNDMATFESAQVSNKE